MCASELPRSAQAFEAIQIISRDFREKLAAYVHAISTDIVTPVQVAKMYVEAAPFIMDPVKLGAYLSATTNTNAAEQRAPEMLLLP